VNQFLTFNAMKVKYQSRYRLFFLVAILSIVFTKIYCQTTIPDILIKSPLKEQMNYIEERTRIFENYRAIREDMFQKLTQNIVDTLSEAKNKFTLLNQEASTLKHIIDSLNTDINTTQNRLDVVTRTKNSIRVLGFEIRKVIYNTIMWTILLGLAGILVMGMYSFKHNLTVTKNTKKEFLKLKDEFETYRKTNREAREKLSMDHFREIKKLKGS
jgi:hypothetical protein